jgi:hypothetical protein
MNLPIEYAIGIGDGGEDTVNSDVASLASSVETRDPVGEPGIPY